MAAKYNEKILNAIALAVRPTTRQLTFEGTIRSSKTVTAIEAFFWRMYFSSGRRFVVASYDKDTLNDNILQADSDFSRDSRTTAPNSKRTGSAGIISKSTAAVAALRK